MLSEKGSVEVLIRIKNNFTEVSFTRRLDAW